MNVVEPSGLGESVVVVVMELEEEKIDVNEEFVVDPSEEAPPGFGESETEPPGCIVLAMKTTVPTMMTTATTTATQVVPIVFLRIDFLTLTVPSTQEQ